MLFWRLPGSRSGSFLSLLGRWALERPRRKTPLVCTSDAERQALREHDRKTETSQGGTHVRDYSRPR